MRRGKAAPREQTWVAGTSSQLEKSISSRFFQLTYKELRGPRRGSGKRWRRWEERCTEREGSVQSSVGRPLFALADDAKRLEVDHGREGHCDYDLGVLRTADTFAGKTTPQDSRSTHAYTHLTIHPPPPPTRPALHRARHLVALQHPDFVLSRAVAAGQPHSVVRRARLTTTRAVPFARTTL